MQRPDDDRSDFSSFSESNKTVSADITVFVDNHAVTALIDTGADYSVMSGALASKLRKVTTP